jgi:hypothetical protein
VARIHREAELSLLSDREVLTKHFVDTFVLSSKPFENHGGLVHEISSLVPNWMLIHFFLDGLKIKPLQVQLLKIFLDVFAKEKLLVLGVSKEIV